MHIDLVYPIPMKPWEVGDLALRPVHQRGDVTGLPVAIIAGCPAVAEAKLDRVEEVVVFRSPLEADEVVRGDGDNLGVLVLGQAHRRGPDASVPFS